MIKCTQPGCTGTIVDGYCDVCGSPGPANHPADVAPATAASAASSDTVIPQATTADLEGTPCTQPGCTGTIIDGYCDVCGTPAAAVPAAVSGDDQAPLSTSAPASAMTGGSSQ